MMNNESSVVTAATKKTVWSDALQRMRARIEWTAQTTTDGFPHFADPASGTWTTSPDGDWTGGFWVGMLWLAAHASGEDRFRRWAQRWSERLRSRSASDTVFRGFLFYYGAALGDVLCKDVGARDVALQGARALAALFHPAAGLIPLGTAAEEAENVGRSEANVDGLQASALLAWAGRQTGDAGLQVIAARHARTSLEVFVRTDASVCQSVSFDPEQGRVLRSYTHKGYTDQSTWTRAQAWALLGTTVDAIWLPAERPRLVEAARRVADWWLRSIPRDHIAYWDFDAPQDGTTPRDTSGTAIAAAALLKLAALCEDADDRLRYQSAAEATVEALVSSHLTPVDSSDARPPGILIHGCYNKRIDLATDNELIWGSYYLFEALNVLNGSLDALAV